MRLPRIVLSEILSAPLLEVEVIEMMEGPITMILSTVTTKLSRLDGITRRWARGRDRYCVRSFSDAIEVRANRSPPLLLLLLLCIDMGEVLLLGCNKSFDRLGVLKCLCISVELQNYDVIIDVCSEAFREFSSHLALHGHHHRSESR